MEVVLAVAADAEEIALMSRDYIEDGLGWSWNGARVGRAIIEPEMIVAIVREKNTIAGFSIMLFNEEAAHLSLLAVRPQYRGSGIGRALITWLEASAKTAGTFKVSLEVREGNKVAQQFYRCLGYESAELLEGYYREKESAVRMCKDVSVR